MIDFFTMSGATMSPQEVIRMTEERPARLVNMPTTYRGFCYHDDDGEEFVVLNARHTREANHKTWLHERSHIRRGELYNTTYREYEEEST